MCVDGAHLARQVNRPGALSLSVSLTRRTRQPSRRAQIAMSAASQRRSQYTQYGKKNNKKKKKQHTSHVVDYKNKMSGIFQCNTGGENDKVGLGVTQTQPFHPALLIFIPPGTNAGRKVAHQTPPAAQCRIR